MADSILQAILPHTSVEPRDYQVRIVEKTVRMLLGQNPGADGELEPPARSVMIESPTGSGKSVMGLLIAKAMQSLAGARVGWVAMRRNLLEQVEQENQRKGIHVDLRTVSMFAKDPPTGIDLLVVDEAQHDASNSCSHLHNVIKPRWILGLTATPFRSDLVKLCFDKVVKDAGIHQLIQDGFLSAYDHFTIPRWDAESVADRYCAEPERWGRSIAFFHTVEECHDFDRLMRSRGIASDVVTGSSNRDRQLAAFRDGHVRVLANCMVLTEGFDDPSLQTAWVRPSVKGPTIQMAGRALRRSQDGAVKNIVQCGRTSHPFVKTAAPRHQYLWHPDGWRSFKVNPRIDLCARNACLAISMAPFDPLPKFLQKKQEERRRPRRGRR